MKADHPLQKQVDQASGRVAVLHDAGCARLVAGLTGADLVVRAIEGAAPAEAGDRWNAVVLAVADVAALRRTASVLPRLGRTRSVVLWLAEAEQAALLTPRPEWPAVVNLSARRLPSGAALTVVRFAKPLQTNAVIEQLARAAAPAGVAGGAGLVVATTCPAVEQAPPADPGVLVLDDPADGSDPDRDVPPDIVLAPRGASLEEHAVIGRSPVVVSDPGLLLGPLDEGLLNPSGFEALPGHGPVDLGHDHEGHLVLSTPEGPTRIDPARGATPRIVAGLRAHQGVRVSWRGTTAPDLTRTVAGLAMAGVPLVSAPVPADAAALLGDALTRELTADADLASPLHREEHSVLLRRAALLEHSTLGWRSRLARAAGLSHRAFPSCSIVLATRRPDQLEFALRQVARQRVDAELILATHGFSPDESWVREQLGGRAAVVVPRPAETVFGDVLNAGVAAASGDVVVKMDDDDWYGPDFLTDLLLARHYSGAEVVGMTAEYVYLEELDRTIRRTDSSERVARFVAGGTILTSRAFLASIGGFRPVRKYVDAQLLGATHAAGGSVYRTHGLGYVLRRTASGHTWDAGVDYFLDPSRLSQQWAGFVPSRLMEHDKVLP